MKVSHLILISLILFLFNKYSYELTPCDVYNGGCHDYELCIYNKNKITCKCDNNCGNKLFTLKRQLDNNNKDLPTTEEIIPTIKSLIVNRKTSPPSRVYNSDIVIEEKKPFSGENILLLAGAIGVVVVTIGVIIAAIVIRIFFNLII